MSWLNHRTLVLHPDCESLRDFMLSVPERFDRGEGTVIHKGRNELRKMKYGEQEFVYGIFRPSKAKRSYIHAGMFLEIGVGTPRPVGYINVRRGGLFDRSYYVTYVSPCPYTYEALFKQKFSYEDEVLSEVGRITGILHNHGYAHKDYGRGNILFLHTEQGVYLEVVDLNRLAVGPLDMKAGCKNLERLPATPHMHRVLAEAYAKERGLDPEACYRLMVAYRSTQPGKIDGLY